MWPCMAQLSHPEHWDRLVVHHLAVPVPVHTASTRSPLPSRLLQGNRAGKREWTEQEAGLKDGSGHVSLGVCRELMH